MDLRVQCYYQEAAAELRISFRAVYGRLIRALISFVSETELSFRFPCFFLGWDVWQFIEQLKGLHANLQGRAVLANSGEDVVITFVANGPKIAVHGILVAPSDSESGAQASSIHWGIRISFSEVVFDQSALPELWRSLSHFLKESEVVVDNPWEGDC